MGVGSSPTMNAESIPPVPSMAPGRGLAVTAASCYHGRIPGMEDRIVTEDKYRTLRSKLTVFHDWPHDYTFKFIVPREARDRLETIFEGHPYSVRESSRGRWVALTCVRTMASADAVIEVYQQVDGIEGAWSL